MNIRGIHSWEDAKQALVGAGGILLAIYMWVIFWKGLDLFIESLASWFPPTS